MLVFDENYFQEETRDGFTISEMMKRAWAAQLEVLEEIRRVCKILNIPFFADFGTLLGTIRHKGFIPWDDDLDICMLRKDYMLFLEKAPEYLESWFELKSIYNDPTDDIVKARIINGRHINFDKDFLEKFHDCPYVVGIDVFPVDNVPDDDNDMKKLATSLDFLLRVEASIPEEGPYDEEVLSLVKQIEDTYAIPVDYQNRLRHEIKKIYDILCSYYVGVDTKEVGNMMLLGAGWKGNRYPRECYELLSEMPFENTTIPVQKGYDAILKSYYGDEYMIPKNVGSSHDYPFYKEQIQGLKEVMEREFETTISDEQMEMIIQMKIAEDR